MRSIIKATALLGGASVINILIGLVSAKVAAVLLGPSGFGLMALYQSIVAVAVMIAGLGIPTALTRSMAQAIATKREEVAATLRRSAWAITIGTAVIAACVIAGFAGPISRYALDATAQAGWQFFIAPAIAFALLGAIQIAVLNAHNRVSDLAKTSVLTALFSLVPTIALIYFLREKGLAAAVCAGTVINLFIGNYFYRRIDPEGSCGDSPGDLGAMIRSGRELTAFGVPYLASVMVGAGVIQILPILVLKILGAEEVGYFRAASSIAVNYLSVILLSLSQDYFPRVAAAPDDSEALFKIINDQLHLILLVAGPVIIAMMGAVPYLLQILYSREFIAASEVLEWQLFGDLFKFATWTMGFVIMAKLGSRTFFVTELIGGAILLASSWLGMEWLGLPGLGIAFLVTGIAACFLNWLVLYINRRIVWQRANLVLFCLLALSMGALRIISLSNRPVLSLICTALLAGGFGLYSLHVISKEFGGLKAIMRRRPVST